MKVRIKSFEIILKTVKNIELSERSSGCVTVENKRPSPTKVRPQKRKGKKAHHLATSGRKEEDSHSRRCRVYFGAVATLHSCCWRSMPVLTLPDPERERERQTLAAYIEPRLRSAELSSSQPLYSSSARALSLSHSFYSDGLPK